MSYKSLNWAWELKLPTQEKFILISLADQTNDDGVCWPSKSTLEKRTGLSRSSVKRTLQSLEKSGLIKRESRFREDGSNSSNIYRLCLPEPLGVHADPTKGSTPTRRWVPPGPPRTPIEPIQSKERSSPSLHSSETTKNDACASLSQNSKDQKIPKPLQGLPLFLRDKKFVRNFWGQFYRWKGWCEIIPRINVEREIIFAHGKAWGEPTIRDVGAYLTQWFKIRLKEEKRADEIDGIADDRLEERTQKNQNRPSTGGFVAIGEVGG